MKEIKEERREGIIFLAIVAIVFVLLLIGMFSLGYYFGQSTKKSTVVHTAIYE